MLATAPMLYTLFISIMAFNRSTVKIDILLRLAMYDPRQLCDPSFSSKVALPPSLLPPFPPTVLATADAFYIFLDVP